MHSTPFRDPDAPRILIIRLSAIGDCVMASPVAQSLRQRYPGAFIAWAVQEKSRGVVEGNPHLDEVIVVKRGLQGWRDALQTVRARRFDVVLDLQGLLKSKPLMGLSGAPRRLVSPRFGRLSRWISTERVRHPSGFIYPPLRYICWAQALDAPAENPRLTVPFDDADRAAAHSLLDAAGVEEGALLIALNPGVSAANRKWPVEKFARAASLLAERHPEARFVALGGPQDADDAAYLGAKLGARCLSAAGKLSLRGTAALLERCTLLLSNDTGPLHIAVAVRTPVVGVFGPVAARLRLPPPEWGVPCEGVERNAVCAMLGRPQCVGKGADARCSCLASVSPEDVAAGAEKLLRTIEAGGAGTREHR